MSLPTKILPENYKIGLKHFTVSAKSHADFPTWSASNGLYRASLHKEQSILLSFIPPLNTSLSSFHTIVHGWAEQEKHQHFLLHIAETDISCRAFKSTGAAKEKTGGV